MSNEKKVVITADEEVKEEYELENAVVITDDDDFEEENIKIEDLDDKEVLWENGPTAGDIKKWKAEHGDIYVTSLTFDKHVVWRTLTRNEYKQLVKKMEQLVQAGQLTTAEANLWNEDAIAEVCILFPSYDKAGLSNEMAGLPSLLSQEILEASGFVALEVRQL